LCLQVEADDDTEGKVASDISDKSDDVINSGMLSERQVNNFVFEDFVTHYILDALSYFISVTVYKVKRCVRHPLIV